MAYGNNRFGNQSGSRGGGGYGNNRGGGGRDGDKVYPNSGGLWQRDKRGPSSPDQGGEFTIDDDVLDYVMQCVEAGDQVKLEISAWRKQGRQGDFLSLTVNIPYKIRQEREGGYRGGGRPSNRFRDDGPRGGEERQQFRGRDEQREEPRRSNPYAAQRDRGSSPRDDQAEGRLDQDEIPFNKPYR